MYPVPPARLSDRPLHSRGTSSASSITAREYKQTSFDVDTSLEFKRHEQLNHRSAPQGYVKWGIAWHPPTLMVVYGFGGTALAIGHHFYFSSLHGSLAGTSDQQQWAIAFGTAMSFLVVTLLRAATCAAYSQYVWTILRRRGFSISTIDKLFALTTDPTGFLGVEIWRSAKIAIVVAIVSWITPLAGVAPPATLSVIQGLVVDIRPTSMATLDWNSPAFWERQRTYTLPSSNVIRIATTSALSSQVVPLTPPAPNSTFSLQFYGPAVECSPANTNKTYQQVLEHYQSALAKTFEQNNQFQRPIITKRILESGLKQYVNLSAEFQPILTDVSMLVLSAFTPYAGVQGWMYGYGAPESDFVDAFNNWDTDIPWELDEMGYNVVSSGGSYLYDDIVQKLFVQTSTDGFICMMGNATYDVDYEFINGVQSLIRYKTSDFEPLLMMRTGGGASGGFMSERIEDGPYTRVYHTRFEFSYMAVWQAFTSLINGNVTFRYENSPNQGFDNIQSNLTSGDFSSRILSTGLAACDDIVHSNWEKFPQSVNRTWNKFPDPRQPYDFLESTQRTDSSTSNHFFDHSTSGCRNKTLARAIEDLAGNITIGMLSSANLSSPNATIVNVTYQKTRNIYQYDSRNLIISYATAVILSLIGGGIGLFAFLDNGVAHSTAFSAVIATTRNPELDALSKGHSLGAIPLDKSIAKVKLRFGVLSTVAQREFGVEGHIGFGIESHVSEVERGGKYT